MSSGWDDSSDADFIAAQRNELFDELILDGRAQRYRVERAPPMLGYSGEDFGKDLLSALHTVGTPVLSAFGAGGLAKSLESIEKPYLRSWAQDGGIFASKGGAGGGGGQPQLTPQQQQQQAAIMQQAAQAAQKQKDAQRTWLWIGGGVLGAALLVTLTALIARR